MVRETEMGTDVLPGLSHRSAVRPSIVPALTFPAWLADDSPKSSLSSRSTHRSTHRSDRSDQPVPCSKGRSRRLKAVADEAAALPSYHKLSVDLINSMSGKVPAGLFVSKETKKN